MKKLLCVYMFCITTQSVAVYKYYAVAECASRLKVPSKMVAALLFNLECVMQSEQTRDTYRHAARIQSECGLSDAHKRQSILYPLSYRSQTQVALTTDSLLTTLYQHTKKRPQLDALGVWTFNVRGPFEDSLTADFPTIAKLLENGDINNIRQYPEYFLENIHSIMYDRIQD